MTDKIINKQKDKAISLLEKTPIVSYVCKKIDISRSTFYRWQNEDTEFKNSSQKAIYEGKLEINDFAESQLINLIKDKNITAIIYWLKYNHPSYSDKERIINVVYDHLPPEQAKLIETAIKNNKPKKYGTRNKSK